MSILERTPLDRGYPWSARPGYPIVQCALFFLWLGRLVSPSAWLLSFFKTRAPDGRMHTAANATEYYVIITQLTALLYLTLAPEKWLHLLAVQFVTALLIIEICQRHLYLMVIRTGVDKNYVPYNFSRTLILTLVSYQGLITLFALQYLSGFSDKFGNKPLSRISAWAMSAGIFTGTGFSGITATVGTTASVVAGLQSIVGILFLSVIVGLVLSRASGTAESSTVVRNDHVGSKST
jgi:hypothetical protein